MTILTSRIRPDATTCPVFIKRSKSNIVQRTRHKAENWKQLEILWILFALGVAVLYFYLKSPSVIGAAGERRVNATLSRKLDKQDYTILEDLTLPTLQGTTQIDHIVLSRFGVFVIETKNMSGWILGGENQARWTQVMRRHKSQFQNPLRQNYLHVRVVQDLLGIRHDQLENLVAFVGSAEPKTEMPWNVFWSRGDLYNYVASQRAVRFTGPFGSLTPKCVSLSTSCETAPCRRARNKGALTSSTSKKRPAKRKLTLRYALDVEKR